MENKPDVLVVEDDKTLNTMVCRYVEMAGFPTRSALDGITALSIAREHPPAVILLDLMLPDTTGFEVCQQLKSDDRTRGVPVIMVTALTDDESRRRGMECGAIAYMTKPFDPDELIENIRRCAA